MRTLDEGFYEILRELQTEHGMEGPPEWKTEKGKAAPTAVFQEAWRRYYQEEPTAGNVYGRMGLRSGEEESGEVN